MRDLFRLIDAICEAYDNPEWRPHKTESGVLETHCNLATNHVCVKMGYKGFQTAEWIMLANDMVKKMKSDKEWMAVDPSLAQQYANLGSLVVAGQWKAGHGHVCVVRPGIAVASAKWNMNAPKVLNMGKDVFISKSMSWAFKDRPETWVWTGSL